MTPTKPPKSLLARVVALQEEALRACLGLAVEAGISITIPNKLSENHWLLTMFTDLIDFDESK
jgi:hypothetical protein